jgi:hypothetical protein
MRIHDILIRIRIRGSIPLTNGSGSRSWIRGVPAILSLTFKMSTKTNFFRFSAYFFLKVHCTFTSFFKVFLTICCLMIEGAVSVSQRYGFGAGSVPLTNGSGSWRPKNTQIRICNTAKEYAKRCKNWTVQVYTEKKKI